MLRTKPEARGWTAARAAGTTQPWSAINSPGFDAPPAQTDEVDEGTFDPQRSYLLPRFRAFYAELMRIKRVALRDAPALLVAPPPGVVPVIDARQLAKAASGRLQQTLEQLAVDVAAERGATGARLFQEAQYAMAALADETFLNTEWSGREAWLDSMLEQALFGTQVAGEEIFTRLDSLLATRTMAAVEVATIYFLVLALGFQGRFRGQDPALIDRYRDRLYRFLYRQDYHLAPRFIVAQAYDHTVGDWRPTRLPYVQRWALALTISIVAYFVASHIVWRSLTSEIADTTVRILAYASDGEAR
jgi:type VI secretion system protein ImpK